MHTLKVNLYSFGRETFDDEVRDLLHELRQRGRVESQLVTPLAAQFRLSTEMTDGQLRNELQERGFTAQNGFSVNPYVDDHEHEGQ